MALSLPLILVVFDWFYGRRFSKRVLIEKIPIFLYIIGYCLDNLCVKYESSRWEFLSARGIDLGSGHLVFIFGNFSFPFNFSLIMYCLIQ